jgi:hypothetical protein
VPASIRQSRTAQGRAILTVVRGLVLAKQCLVALLALGIGRVDGGDDRRVLLALYVAVNSQ